MAARVSKPGGMTWLGYTQGACLAGPGLERVAFTLVYATHSTSLFFEHLHAFR